MYGPTTGHMVSAGTAAFGGRQIIFMFLLLPVETLITLKHHLLCFITTYSFLELM